MEYIDVLKALADYNRLAIMCYLRSGKKCACEVEQVLSISQSATSKHLLKLRLVGLIEAQKTAQWVYYNIPSKVYSEYPFLDTLLEQASDKFSFDTIELKNTDC